MDLRFSVVERNRQKFGKLTSFMERPQALDCTDLGYRFFDKFLCGRNPKQEKGHAKARRRKESNSVAGRSPQGR